MVASLRVLDREMVWLEKFQEECCGCGEVRSIHTGRKRELFETSRTRIGRTSARSVVLGLRELTVASHVVWTPEPCDGCTEAF